MPDAVDGASGSTGRFDRACARCGCLCVLEVACRRLATSHLPLALLQLLLARRTQSPLPPRDLDLSRTKVGVEPLFALLGECTLLRKLRIQETHTLAQASAIDGGGGAGTGLSIEAWLRLPPQDSLLLPSMTDLDLRMSFVDASIVSALAAAINVRPRAALRAVAVVALLHLFSVPVHGVQRNGLVQDAHVSISQQA